jgi:hypothetical protein
MVASGRPDITFAEILVEVNGMKTVILTRENPVGGKNGSWQIAIGSAKTPPKSARSISKADYGPLYPGKRVSRHDGRVRSTRLHLIGRKSVNRPLPSFSIGASCSCCGSVSAHDSASAGNMQIVGWIVGWTHRLTRPVKKSCWASSNGCSHSRPLPSPGSAWRARRHSNRSARVQMF